MTFAKIVISQEITIWTDLWTHELDAYLLQVDKQRNYFVMNCNVIVLQRLQIYDVQMYWR